MEKIGINSFLSREAVEPEVNPATCAPVPVHSHMRFMTYCALEYWLASGRMIFI